MKRFAGLAVVVATFGLASCQDATRPDVDALLLSKRDGGQGVDVVVVLDRADAPNGHVAARARATDVASALGLAARHAYGAALYGFAATVPEGRLAALERDPRVKYVQRDRMYAVPTPRVEAPKWCQDNPTHPACGGDGGGSGQTVPWGIARIGADQNANTAAGIHVYVIDTGIDSDHADLAGNVGNGFAAVSCRGKRNVCRQSWDDDHGHGSHVSGTIGALDNTSGVVGVAPGVTLHAVKVCSASGSCPGSAIIAGIDWATAEVTARGAAAVGNMSLGGSGSKSGACNDDGTFSGTDAEHEALCNARHAGLVVATSAGNSGADAQNFTPAAFDDATIAVSATSEGDDWPSWSNWGNDAAPWTADNSAPVAIAAPGVSVLSTWNDGGTNTISGTSMASPHVAGTIALYLASHQGQSADGAAFLNARAALLGAAESTAGFSNSSGNPHAEGFLNARGQ